MKKIVSISLSLCIVISAFAGGQKETGRDQALDTAAEGQLIPNTIIDTASYLEDFELEYKNNTKEPLLINVDLLKNTVWESGEDISLRITLASNTENYFNNSVSGDFIYYFQNPQLLIQTAIQDALLQSIQKNDKISFFLFDPVNKIILSIKTKNELQNAVKTLSLQKKVYENNTALQYLLTAIQNIHLSSRSHVLWISDENIAEKTSDLNFFKFSMNVLNTNKSTFSYLAYGKIPNWTAINNELTIMNGNTYFGDSSKEIIDHIATDIKYFTHPAIEDIHVKIKWSKFIKELSTYYPESSYGFISSFSPAYNNSRPKTEHFMGGMNYEENKRYIHYLSIPSLFTLEENEYTPYLTDKGSYTIATVYIDYFVPQQNKRMYHQEDISITYTDSNNVTDAVNRNVLRDTIIQNTPLILQETANLVNRSKNYLTAIQLVNIQKNLIISLQKEFYDTAFQTDIDLLMKYYDILFAQAKVMNLIQ